MKIRILRCFAFLCCGANGNRTSDTRIFSPLLYQLSYGTIACCLNKGAVAFCSAKVGDFCHNSKFLLKKLHESRKFAVSLHTLSSRSGCSAVGSALRSGRRGRAFESPHPDQNKNKELNFSSLFLFPKGSSPPQSDVISVKIRYRLRQNPVSSSSKSDIIFVKIRYHLRQNPISSPSKTGIISAPIRYRLCQKPVSSPSKSVFVAF